MLSSFLSFDTSHVLHVTDCLKPFFGAGIRILVSYQCGLGLAINVGGVCCWYSSLLLEAFSCFAGTPVFPSRHLLLFTEENIPLP